MNTWRLEVYPELGSTSDKIIERAKAGEAAGLAVIALKQTAARGSRGRAWSAPEGNLSLSVLLRPSCPAVEAGLFSLMAGVAVIEALAELGAKNLSLKWPNDVLCQNAKLAGVLIDAVPEQGKLSWLALGIGVNLLVAPEISGRLTTALARQGIEVTPQRTAEAILARLAVWQQASAAEIRQAWLAHGHALGTVLEIAYGDRRLKGFFAGLSGNGELQLDVENRIETLNTGEVLLAGR